MLALSSITITPPEPAIVPAASSESKSIATSISSAVSTFADIPPGITALRLCPRRTPCAWRSISSRSVIPTGAS